MLNEFGLSSAIIQDNELDSVKISSLFYVNITIGIIMTIFTFLTAGLIASFFNEPALKEMIQLISVVFIIISAGFIQRSLMRKRMEFKKLFNADIISIILYGIISITLAYNGFGVYSLIIGYLAKSLFQAILYHIFNPWYPGLEFDFNEIKYSLNFGANVFGASVVNYVKRNFDYLIIGRILGAEALGYYTLAYKLMLVPVRKIGGVINNTFFPSFSQIKNQPLKIKKYYLKVLSMIALITFPMMAGLFIVAPEFINLVYGSDWSQAIIVIQILTIVGALQSLSTTAGTIYYSQGRADISLKYNLFTTVLLLIAFSLGVKWGIEGVAIAYAIYGIIANPVLFYIIGNLIEMSLLDLFHAVKKPLYYTIFMFGSLQILNLIFIDQIFISLMSNLIVTVVSGVILYSTMVLLFDRKYYLNEINKIKESL
jgi:PST family polysaccharide transporter